MLASTGDSCGSNTRWRYILTCLLGSFLNYIRYFTNEQSLIISWTFRILAHEEDQYRPTVMFRKYWADFLSIALKQTKTGVWASELGNSCSLRLIAALDNASAGTLCWKNGWGSASTISWPNAGLMLIQRLRVSGISSRGTWRNG